MTDSIFRLLGLNNKLFILELLMIGYYVRWRYGGDCTQMSLEALYPQAE